MIAVEWNQLLVDDHVVLHERPQGDGARAQRCTIVSVQPRSPDNEVGVRVDGSSDDALRWPGRLEVHAATEVATALCPWCALGGARVAPPTAPPAPAAASGLR